MNENNTVNPLRFNGRTGEFFGIWIVNILLSVVTLGVYSAWAKVRTKRYFYGNTYLAEDNFEYHGTPKQILKGRAVAMLCLLMWVMLSSVSEVASAVLLILFYLVLPWMMWSNVRFDSAMTSYRNTHFAFAGTLKQAYITFMGRGVVAILGFILGISVIVVITRMVNSVLLIVVMAIAFVALCAFIQAWVMTGVWRYFMNGYRYGNAEFSAILTSKKLFFINLGAIGIFISGVLMMLVLGCIFFYSMVMNIIMDIDLFMYSMNDTMFGSIILGYLLLIIIGMISAAYMSVRIRNYVYSQTSVSLENQSLKLNSSFSVLKYVGLLLTNILGLIFTLGLAHPWVKVRMANYAAEQTQVIGDLEMIKAVDQDSDVRSALGDELVQAFDINLGIG
ncbi:YjgN family protein [Vibrio spartinae]|uniref:Inner membrane protein YjgN n=1 Tax=Vibrio spartinae TaxID=1918945 RepID=A0A1N6M1Z9_9VIBR|nr:YjgN family protein [Vibrio spartinae]QMV13232.1 Inner membrane protein YjgN [Vibrio spartinae]SIO93463.1 Inner membrane protein YjgN [Vibrio spartinae]